MSVVDVLGLSPAALHDVVIVSEGRAWTKRELESAVDVRAQALRATTTAGTVVPFVIDSDARSVIELFALWRVGAMPAPLNAALTEPERVAAQRTLGAARSGQQAILWTSGTAGRPRGVVLSFAALEASARAARDRLGLSAADVWIASLSPAHVGGLALITRALLLGSRMVLAGRFDAQRVWQLLPGDPRPTHVSVVPTQLVRLLEAARGAPPPRSLRCMLLGGAGAPASLLERALAGGWPIALTYGLTEATSQVATSPPDATRRKPGSVGRPLDGVEVRIARDGEILVRGATLAVGYVGADTEPLVDDDGWHHTGDIGRIDAEGDLWVTGRRVDRIVSGGVTIDAIEVEDALRSHSGVADACVVGIPDATWGERVAAWIEPAPAESAIDLDALGAYLKARLAAPKLPRLYHVERGLPRNANGKVDRAAVREVFRVE
jgi:O-succinylbenzoic acid--CoA ligase